MLTGVAGSMAYMAPEILAKRGYTYTIDWWSLGVCAYELIFGRRPFRGRTNTDLTFSISKDNLKFPDDVEKKCSRPGLLALKSVCNSPFSSYDVVSAHTDFPFQLLERDPSKRIGCKPHGEGFRDVQRHPWFKGIDWDLLESKKQPPPFVPDVGRDSNLQILNNLRR